MFVENLREAAKSKQMTQSDVVKASGLSKSSVSDYFTGKSTPKKDALKKLANALGVTVEALTESKTTAEQPTTKHISMNFHVSLANTRQRKALLRKL